MRADPEPKITVRHRHGERTMTAAKADPPEASAFLKTQRAVMRIFFPEPVSFARGFAGIRRERGVSPPEFSAGRGFHPAAWCGRRDNLSGLFQQVGPAARPWRRRQSAGPKSLAQFLKPVGDFMDFLRLQLLDGRLDFLNRAHGATLIQSVPPRNGLFAPRSSSSVWEMRD